MNENTPTEREPSVKLNIGQIQLSAGLNFYNVAEHIVKKLKIFYDEKTKLFYIWNDEKYKHEEITGQAIINKCAELGIIEQPHRNAQCNELIGGLQRAGISKIPQPLKEGEIQFKDKIVNIKTGEIKTATPEYFCINQIPHELGLNEDTPIIDRLCAEWVGENKKELLQEFMAYCLYPAFPIHRIACFTGGGCNGKSVTIELIKNLTGRDNTASAELETICKERFGLSVIYHKLLVSCGETNWTTLSATGRFKSLSGGDELELEFKGKDRISYKPNCKIILATNSLPPTNDKTDGFYRRWLIINFPNQFNPNKQIDILSQIPQTEYSNFCTKATRLLKKIITNGGFTNEGTLQEKERIYETLSEPIYAFTKENLIEDENSAIPVKEMERKLNEFLKINGYRRLNERELCKKLKDIDYEKGSERINGRITKAWKNVRWKTQEDFLK